MIQITPLTAKDHLQHLCEFINCCNLTKVENARAREIEPHSANGGVSGCCRSDTTSWAGASACRSGT
jgi:hypothetical protein